MPGVDNCIYCGVIKYAGKPDAQGLDQALKYCARCNFVAHFHYAEHPHIGRYNGCRGFEPMDDLVACDICQSLLLHGAIPQGYDRRRCIHCERRLLDHDWVPHPHLARDYLHEGCPGWTEALDESFED